MMFSKRAKPELAGQRHQEFPHIVSVSWGDHLVFGEGDGRLHTPEATQRRMLSWREELRAQAIHWRIPRALLPGRFYEAPGYPPTIPQRESAQWNWSLVPQVAHELGLEAYLYLSVFDEGWPLPPKRWRQVSYHNAMHGRHISWQSHFSRQHPEYARVDRSGSTHQWGVLCLAYPEVRAHFKQRFLHLLSQGEWDGLFICLRSQSRPADFADQFGFNQPIRLEYLRRYGRDILAQDFDLQKWRDLEGEYLTQFLTEMRTALKKTGQRLAVGAPRGDVLGPPIGNTTLHWRSWVAQGLVDELVINQNASRCPSMWHDLWPMHRGYGYLQNYLDGSSLPPLKDHILGNYAPIFATSESVCLYVARQWDERDTAEEESLMQIPGMSGLVFSSFRHDNPEAVVRGDWRA